MESGDRNLLQTILKEKIIDSYYLESWGLSQGLSDIVTCLSHPHHALMPSWCCCTSLEKAMAPHSSTLAWKIAWTEEPGRLQSMGSLSQDTTERLHFHFSPSCIGEGNGNPLQCSCLENPRDGDSGGLPSMGSHRVGYD